MSSGGDDNPSGARNWRLVRADSDAVPPSVRRFMARARQRRLRAAAPWAITAGVVAVAVALGWTVYGTDVFGVRDVRVVGTEVATPEGVRAAAAVATDMPIARVDLDAVRDRVQALAPVDRAIVSRDWPDTIVIEVVERTPVAAVPFGTRFRLIDAEGVAFRTLRRAPAGLPVARLADPGPADLNTRAALVVLSSLTDELREQVVAVAVPAPARIRLELRRGREVVWGDETDSETKSRVATNLLRLAGKTIDVSAPEVVTIR
ncbi:MAG TPA: FtsQ-type POTRA domain-containing protein [Actinoplanes sp.]|nr:FtsQ-type POTRA domain-containing protein [Actinoplanes sp.]